MWTHNQTEFVLKFVELGAAPTRKNVETLAGGPMPNMPVVIARELGRITPYGVGFWMEEWVREGFTLEGTISSMVSYYNAWVAEFPEDKEWLDDIFEKHDN